MNERTLTELLNASFQQNIEPQKRGCPIRDILFIRDFDWSNDFLFIVRYTSCMIGKIIGRLLVFS